VPGGNPSIDQEGPVSRVRISVVVGIIALAGSAALVAGHRAAAAAGSHAGQGHPSKEGHGERRELKPESKFVTGDGVVIAVRLEKQQLVLEHGEITGFMPAMTMGYKTSPTSLLNTVRPGDRVRFTIDTDARAITKIDKLAD
jgi:Cu/Ag efflux protein CusF